MPLTGGDVAGGLSRPSRNPNRRRGPFGMPFDPDAGMDYHPTPMGQTVNTFDLSQYNVGPEPEPDQATQIDEE